MILNLPNLIKITSLKSCHRFNSQKNQLSRMSHCSLAFFWMLSEGWMYLEISFKQNSKRHRFICHFAPSLPSKSNPFHPHPTSSTLPYQHNIQRMTSFCHFPNDPVRFQIKSHRHASCDCCCDHRNLCEICCLWFCSLIRKIYVVQVLQIRVTGEPKKLKWSRFTFFTYTSKLAEWSFDDKIWVHQ